jgi:cytochrome oxidase Cu insertion factor (SCO1/SenC/PrrC family)
MPLGLPDLVIRPAAATSPTWVQQVVEAGLTPWLRHPVGAATATVWLQLGIGILLLVAPLGRWSRMAGLVSAGWGVLVWVFGEAFGGIFAPGVDWLFGAPGAALFYLAAGVAIALPERAWAGPRMGRVVFATAGTFFLGMTVLTAWPGSGFWQVDSTGAPGPLGAMAKGMAQTSQPPPTAAAVLWFADLDAQHGVAVNLVVTVVSVLVGVACWYLAVRWRPVLARWTVGLAAVLCLADWVLVQDLGFFGGVGTDPNSMLPLLVWLVTGYLACSRPAAQSVVETTVQEAPSRPLAWLGTVAAISAIAIILVGAVPLTGAAANTQTDAILTRAVNGDPATLDQPAAPFALVNQDGKPVTLAGLRGRAVALTFLDPVCTTDCPLIAQQFKAADRLLGDQGKDAVFVGIAANPVYFSPATLQAFDRQEQLNGLANWLFLTGSLAELQRTWSDYRYQVQTLGAGAMAAHNDITYIIDATGRIRATLGSDPGGDSQTASSLATEIAAQLRTVIGP